MSMDKDDNSYFTIFDSTAIQVIRFIRRGSFYRFKNSARFNAFKNSTTLDFSDSNSLRLNIKDPKMYLCFNEKQMLSEFSNIINEHLMEITFNTPKFNALQRELFPNEPLLSIDLPSNDDEKETTTKHSEPSNDIKSTVSKATQTQAQLIREPLLIFNQLQSPSMIDTECQTDSSSSSLSDSHPPWPPSSPLGATKLNATAPEFIPRASPRSSPKTKAPTLESIPEIDIYDEFNDRKEIDKYQNKKVTTNKIVYTYKKKKTQA